MGIDSSVIDLYEEKITLAKSMIDGSNFDGLKSILEENPQLASERILDIAVRKGNMDMIKLIISSMKSYLGRTNLPIGTISRFIGNAAFYGHLGVVKFFVSIGIYGGYTVDGDWLVSPESVVGYDTPSVKREKDALNNGTKWAIYGGNIDVVRYLASIGSDLLSTDNRMVIWLSTGAFTNPIRLQTNGLFDVMGGTVKLVDMFKLVFELGADLTAGDNYPIRYTPLLGDLEVVEFLVNNSPVDVSTVGKDPVISAIHRGHLGVVKFLIDSGADYIGCGLHKLLGVRNLPRSRKDVSEAVGILMVSKE